MLNTLLGAPDTVRPQMIIPIGYSSDTPSMPKRYKLVDLVYINSWKGKVVNIDLLFDDFSEVMRKKLIEAKDTAVEKAPGIAQSAKNAVLNLHSKIKDKIAERKKKKDEKIDEEIGGEEEVLEDTE